MVTGPTAPLRLSALVGAPMVSSVAPALLLLASIALSEGHVWMARVLIVLLGTVPALGAAVAFGHAGIRTRVVRPLVPYAVLAVVFAVASWIPLLSARREDGAGPGGLGEVVFVGYLYAVPVLPVLAVVGVYAVMHRMGARADVGPGVD